MKYAIVSFAVCLLFMACQKQEPAKTIVVPRHEAPLTAAPIKIDKPVNVSFSTYSKDWPVDWQWIDPDEASDATPHDVKGGVLRIHITSPKDLYGEKRSAPRYLKAITGDFQIETRVRFSPKENYQGAGLLIFSNDNNYIRLERAYGGVGGGGEGIRLDVRTDSAYEPIVTPNDMPTEAGTVDLKLVRRGPVFNAFWRLNEDAEWRECGEFRSAYPETILAGISASNTARPISAEFEYIRLTPVKNQ